MHFEIVGEIDEAQRIARGTSVRERARLSEQFGRGRWRKLYDVVHDAASEQRGHLRVVDESGEDYLYPEEFCAAVEVPEETERALASAV